MKFMRMFLPVMLLVCICSCSSLKIVKKNYDDKPVYVFGVSASFSDTIVYYTDIQLVDSVRLDKNGMLPYRDTYSYQLKNYLEGKKELKNRTCITYFSVNRSKLEKEQAKILGKYNKNTAVTVEKIDASDFTYTKPE